MSLLIKIEFFFLVPKGTFPFTASTGITTMTTTTSTSFTSGLNNNICLKGLSLSHISHKKFEKNDMSKSHKTKIINQKRTKNTKITQKFQKTSFFTQRNLFERSGPRRI